jgi:hypothetical protein
MFADEILAVISHIYKLVIKNGKNHPVHDFFFKTNFEMENIPEKHLF